MTGYRLFVTGCRGLDQFQGVSAMCSKVLVVLIAAATMGVGAAAMAGGGGGGAGGGGGKGGSGGHVGNANFGRFGNGHFDHRFQRNQFLPAWGWGGWGWGPYGEASDSNTSLVVYPQATPQMATGTVAATPCHWNAETFNVPSSGRGNRPVQVVTCQ